MASEKLDSQLAKSLEGIEAAITNIAPEAFELAVRATFLKGISGLVGTLLFSGGCIVAIYALLRIMPAKDGKTISDTEIPRGFCMGGVALAALLGLLFLSVEIGTGLPRIIDPAAITARDMIGAALK